jgi:hypothetical protein
MSAAPDEENNKDVVNSKPIRDIPKERRRSYRQNKRKWELLQIRYDRKRGLSESEIMAKYNMSWGTFHARMEEIRREDNEVIMKHLREQGESMLVVDIKRFDDRLDDAIKFCDKIIDDLKAPWFVKLEAQRLRLDAAYTQVKLRIEGPRLIGELTKNSPVKSLAEGKLSPMQALDTLPKLKRGDAEAEKQYQEYKRVLEEQAKKQVVSDNKGRWVEKVQVEKPQVDSAAGHQKSEG